jgi:hypothetical protein
MEYPHSWGFYHISGYGGACESSMSVLGHLPHDHLRVVVPALWVNRNSQRGILNTSGYHDESLVLRF